MDGVVASRARLGTALTAARVHDVGRIAFALRHGGFTGVHGEAEVGVTSLIEHVLNDAERPYIRLDLNRITSEGDAAQALARGIARDWLGGYPLSHLLLPDGQRPAEADQALVAFTAQMGREMADLVRADQPRDDLSIEMVLAVFEEVYREVGPIPLLWIDHLEGPSSTARHPLDVDALLWTVRSVQQRLGNPVIASGHRAVSALAHGSAAAFHGDGQWVTIVRPSTGVWASALNALNETPPSPSWLLELARIVRGHPPTLMLALSLRTDAGFATRSPSELWEFMLALDDGLVEHTLRQARTLHRLGARTLVRIAKGIGPYEDAGTAARRKEINRAVRRLHESGLITQPRPRTWEITNPLIDGRLRGIDGTAHISA